MTMTNEEICRDYKAAKAPSKQIHILADLNQCSREKIKQILVAGGCKLPGNCENKSKTKSKGVSLAGPLVKLDEDQLDQMFAVQYVKPVNPGAKNDDGKLQLSAVPPELIRAVAAVRAYGKAKYAEAEDWTKVEPKRFHEALLRHALACWEDPYSLDAESGLPSLWHLATNAAFLCAMMKEAKG